MEIYKGLKSDLHTHTVASDGKLTAGELICLAEKGKLTALSITDHDSLGAYKLGIDYIAEAERRGIELIPGIELDSEYKGVEIHVLGYEIDVNSPELNEYLDGVQNLRKRRITELIEGINQKLGKELFKASDVFVGYRDTFMKPHLVHTMLNCGMFEEYRDAAKWIKQNVSARTAVIKPPVQDMIRLIKRAGGKAFLAHPGYYFVEHGLDINELIEECIEAGLDGLEVFYRYGTVGSPWFTEQTAEDTVKLLAEKAERYSLMVSRGSDAHDAEYFDTFVEKVF